jgi:hypothetical protein
MLESVDVLKGARESLRRVVRIPCDLVSETFDEPVELEITDLSADGAFVETNLALADGRRARHRLRGTAYTAAARRARPRLPRRAPPSTRRRAPLRYGPSSSSDSARAPER